MSCPTCGLGAFVVHDEIGHRCTLCGIDWPYTEEETVVLNDLAERDEQ